ncbi:MAG: hypothetical protein EB060_05965 [Proteobacteria bacterium]|nr:hypothetical protein [Pseudomonadota bacterium]
MRTVAIMQPYFIPYAGYFRLFAATDLFVIYDCVQFPRRGWVHRNQLTLTSGEKDWLTLPLKKAPQDVKIKDLAFATDVEERFDEESLRFKAFQEDHPLLATCLDFSSQPLAYITDLMQKSCRALGLHFSTLYSSSLNIPETVHAEDRILAICEAVGATHYVNASGGRELYDATTFKKRGISLAFLPEYKGSYNSILERLVFEKASDVAKEICSQSKC